MNFRDAAYEVLKKEGKPLSTKEIFEIALREELITTHGKTPVATMGAAIYKDMGQKDEKSLFVKIKRGIFGLRERHEEIRKEEDESIRNLSQADLIVEHLRESQSNIETPMDFENVIKDAFAFLGFEAKPLGGSGDTDVLLTAKIGNKKLKVCVDGKTSRTGMIKEIDWPSLKDHRRKNEADFTVVVGPGFAGGKFEERTKEFNVSLLETEDLVRLVEAHSEFPFTLVELRDLLSGSGDRSSQLEDLLAQNLSRRSLLEQLRTVFEKMIYLQERKGYFSTESLSVKIEEFDIEDQDIEDIINLLKLPFINGVEEVSEKKYILTISIKDIANIFRQISSFLISPEGKEESLPMTPEIKEESAVEKKLGSKYFKWNKKGSSIVVVARRDKPYEHYCPIEHFQTILNKIVEAFKKQSIIGTDTIFSMLQGQNLSPDRSFKGKTEEYKIRMALGVLEIEELIKWKGSKKPIEYELNAQIEEIEKWIHENIEEKIKSHN